MKSTANPPLASLYQNGQGAGSTAPHPDHLGKNRVLFESSFIPGSACVPTAGTKNVSLVFLLEQAACIHLPPMWYWSRCQKCSGQSYCRCCLGRQELRHKLR